MRDDCSRRKSRRTEALFSVILSPDSQTLFPMRPEEPILTISDRDPDEDCRSSPQHTPKRALRLELKLENVGIMDHKEADSALVCGARLSTAGVLGKEQML